MAKIFKKKSSSKAVDYSNYLKDDPLFDLLRNYYSSKCGLDSEEWKNICKRDIENMKIKKKKEINDRRNYGTV